MRLESNYGAFVMKFHYMILARENFSFPDVSEAEGWQIGRSKSSGRKVRHAETCLSPITSVRLDNLTQFLSTQNPTIQLDIIRFPSLHNTVANTTESVYLGPSFRTPPLPVQKRENFPRSFEAAANKKPPKQKLAKGGKHDGANRRETWQELIRRVQRAAGWGAESCGIEGWNG
ncbi:hypothetical protein Trydic_g3774 [Trypoxylus dichotomus]